MLVRVMPIRFTTVCSFEFRIYRCLVKEGETHVLLLLLSRSRGGRRRSRRGRSAAAAAAAATAAAVLAGVGNGVFDEIGLLEADIGRDCDLEAVLEGIEHHVRHGAGGRVANHKAQRRNALRDGHKSLLDVLVIDVKDGRIDETLTIEDAHDLEAVRERLHAELAKKHSLGRTNLGTGRGKLNLRDNLDGTLGDLSGNTESLEETSLGRLEAGRTRLKNDVALRHSAGLGRSSDLKSTRVRSLS